MVGAQGWGSALGGPSQGAKPVQMPPPSVGGPRTHPHEVEHHHHEVEHHHHEVEHHEGERVRIHREIHVERRVDDDDDKGPRGSRRSEREEEPNEPDSSGPDSSDMKKMINSGMDVEEI